MKVTKCDRCGAVIETENGPKMKAALSEHLWFDKPQDTICADLCYECYYDLDNWFKEGKNE